MANAPDYFETRAKEIRDSLTHFMLNHSEIEPRKPYDEIWFIGPEGDRYYADLDSVGTKMQAYLSECYGEFYSMLQAMVKEQPEDVVAKMEKAKEVITKTIDHKITWCESSKMALDQALAALEDQLNTVRALYE